MSEQIQEIQALRAELAKLHDQRFLRMHNSWLALVGVSLLRGLIFGLGSVIGATVLLSILVWSLGQMEFLPILGEWAQEIVRIVEEER